MPDWQTYSRLGLPTCIPCCNGGVPPVCECRLTLPLAGDVYESQSAAATAIADTVFGCLIATESAPTTAPTASFNGTTLAIDCASDFAPSDYYASVSVDDEATLSVVYSCTYSGTGTPSVTLYVYDCEGAFIVRDDLTGDSGTLTCTLSSAGEYSLKFHFEVDSGTATALSYDLTANTTLIINPVGAFYDSGTPDEPRLVDACPKLLLPLLTEQSGTWFEDETAAQDWIDAWTKECIAAVAEDWAYTWTASFASEEMTITGDSGAVDRDHFDTFYFSVNAVAGETLTLTFTAGANTEGAFTIYANYGEAPGERVEDVGYGASPITSSALPYTGRYMIAVSLANPAPSTDPKFTTASFVLSSSGTLSINEIQALYDAGLSCPGRLDCIVP